MAVTFAKPKRPESDNDQLDKGDLVGALITFTLKEYDPQLPTAYGKTTAAYVDLIVVDGKHAGKVEDRWAAFGNLGRQIGEALELDDRAVGRITTGESASGRSWFGIDYAEEPGDFEAAEKAIEGLAGNASTDAPF